MFHFFLSYIMVIYIFCQFLYKYCLPFSATVCKKTWTSLRDSYRRVLKRKRETKSGQAASQNKKWKFEDEMSFLLPFMQERDTYSNLKDVSDDDSEDPPNKEPNIDEHDDENGRKDDRNDDKRDDQNNDKNDDKDNDVDDVDEELHAKEKKRKIINKKIITNVARNKTKNYQTQQKTASAIMMEYLLDKKTKAQITPPTQ